MGTPLIRIRRSLRTRIIVSRLNENHKTLSKAGAIDIESWIRALGKVSGCRRRGTWDRNTKVAIASAKRLTKNARRGLLDLNRETIAFVTSLCEPSGRIR